MAVGASDDADSFNPDADGGEEARCRKRTEHAGLVDPGALPQPQPGRSTRLVDEKATTRIGIEQAAHRQPGDRRRLTGGGTVR